MFSSVIQAVAAPVPPGNYWSVATIYTEEMVGGAPVISILDVDADDIDIP